MKNDSSTEKETLSPVALSLHFPSILSNDSISQVLSWPFQQKGKEGRLRFWERVLSKKDETDLFELCKHLIPELATESQGGKETRRLSGGFGEPDYKYAYKETVRTAKPFPPWMKRLKDQVSEMFHQPFEFVLMNYYPDDRSGIGDHADNEYDMSKRSSIVCLSLGHPHTLRIRYKNEQKHVLQITLPSAPCTRWKKNSKSFSTTVRFLSQMMETYPVQYGLVSLSGISSKRNFKH